MDSEKATAVSPGSSLSAPRRSVLDLLRSAAMTPAATSQARGVKSRRRSSPAGKRNGEDGPILSPCAAAGSVRACARADTVIDNRFYVVFFL